MLVVISCLTTYLGLTSPQARFGAIVAPEFAKYICHPQLLANQILSLPDAQSWLEACSKADAVISPEELSRLVTAVVIRVLEPSATQAVRFIPCEDADYTEETSLREDQPCDDDGATPVCLDEFSADPRFAPYIAFFTKHAEDVVSAARAIAEHHMKHGPDACDFV